MTQGVRSTVQPLAAAALAALAVGCGEPDGPRRIEDTRVGSVPARVVVPDATTAQRFQLSRPHAPADDAAGGVPAAPEMPFVYDVPDGWVERERTRHRLINLQVADAPEAECVLSVLVGDGGGLVDNVNRWRAQMDLPSAAPEEILALPRRTVFGVDEMGVAIDLAGDYTGMFAQPIEDARLLGVVVPAPQLTIFVKFTGPADVVERERDAYEAFLDSLAFAGESAPAGGESAPSDGAVAGPGAGLAWEAPPRWTREPGTRPMREVTFRVPDPERPGTDALAAEAYVSVLPGRAGGVLANVDRWRRQFGLPALTAAERTTLETIDVLGRPAVVVDARGTFTGTSGLEEHPDHALVGVALERGDESVFVKLVGPSGAVDAARDELLAFAGSLRETAAPTSTPDGEGGGR